MTTVFYSMKAIALIMLVALALAMPMAFPRSTAGGKEYDIGLAVNALTLVLVGAYTYLTYQLLKHSQEASDKERCRRRDVLATALLVELVVVEDQLRDLYNGPLTQYSGHIEFPVLRRAIDAIDLFDPDTAYVLARLHRELIRVERMAAAHWSTARGNPAIRISLDTADCNQVVFVLHLLDQLQKKLRPLSPNILEPWLTYPDDSKGRLPLGESAFKDIPETEIDKPASAQKR